MFKFIKFLTILICVNLSGCKHFSGTLKIDTNTGNCSIKDIKLLSASNESMDSLHAKKDKINSSMLWLTYTPQSIMRIPLEKPIVIVKNEHGQELFRIHGVSHAKAECGLTLKADKRLYYVCRKLEKHTNSEISAEEIWGLKGSYYDVFYNRAAEDHPDGEIAVSFRLSKDQLKQILDREKIAILIQTVEEPSIFQLGKLALDPLRTFQQRCM